MEGTMKIPCNRCKTSSDAYYILSTKTKGLYIQCPKCKTHTAPYIENLDIPYKPSESYRSIQKLKKLINPTGGQIKGVGTQISL
jgi:hypothetical protein